VDHEQRLDPLRTWAQSINKVLAAYRDLAASVTTHKGIIGESREFFICEVLRRFLPQSVHVGTGQTVDKHGSYSNQINIVISRPDCPILTSLALGNIYLIESVMAAIEVKSMLSGGEKGTVWQALENVRSVKKQDLEYSSKGIDTGPFENLRWIAPSAYIFGYTGYKNNLANLKQVVDQWIHQCQPSFHELPDVLVTEGCVVLKNDYRFFYSDRIRSLCGFDPVFLAVHNPCGLTWFLYHLLCHITACIGEPAHARTQIRYLIMHNIMGQRSHARQIFEDTAERWGRWDRDTAGVRGVLHGL
jgi:hypothetical protein